MSDRILAVLLLAAAIAYGLVGSTYAPPFAYEPIGPSAFPVLLAVLMALCAVYIFLRPEPEPDWPRGALAVKSVALLAVLILYGLLFIELGFVVATALMSFVIGMLFGGGWLKSAAGGVGMAVVLFLLFDRLLEVTLPVGRIFGG